MVMVLRLATGYPDEDIDYIVLNVLLLNVVVDPLIHAVVRKPVRRAYLQIVKWLIYGCCCGWKLLKPEENFGKKKTVYIYNDSCIQFLPSMNGSCIPTSSIMQLYIINV